MSRSSEQRERRERRAPSERLAQARRIEFVTEAKVACVMALVAALASPLLARVSSYRVFREFGAFAVREPVTGFWETVLHWLQKLGPGSLLALGAVGLWRCKSWGWWVMLLGALAGLGDMLRIYRGLFAIIDPDHPEAASTTMQLLWMVVPPAGLYLGVLALIGQGSVRRSYRI